MIVTDYQFITVMLNIQDFAASRFWWGHHGYPDMKNKYFSIWKNFLLSKIKDKEEHYRLLTFSR